MPKKNVLLIVLLLFSMIINAAPLTVADSSNTDEQQAIKIDEALKKDRAKKLTAAANCYAINWATWTNFTGSPDGVNSVNTTPADATGTVLNSDGTTVNVQMHANYNFYSSINIYQAFKFSGYPSPVPTGVVPETTWAVGANGTTTMTFDRTVTNPVLLIASLGSSQPISARLDFSLPYVVLYNGGGMTYNSSTALTGTEGYAIIMFPGDFKSVTISSSTREYYTNITWGLRPPPFAINIADGPATCGSTSVTASGGAIYEWNGGDTPNQASNTFHTSGTYLVTVTSTDGCVTSASKTVNVNTFLTPPVSGNTTGCGSVTLTASGGDFYQWSGGTSPNSAVNTFTTSGTYTVKTTSSDGCNGISPPIIVNINQPPIVTITGNIPDCNSVTLTANGGVGYEWDGGDRPHNQINTFNTSGTYHVTVTDANGCIGTASINVTILGPIPVIIGSTTGCGTVTLTATGGTGYHWSGGSSPNNATNTFTESGNYTVVVTNSTSCIGTKTINVIVDKFTPTISGITTGCGSVTLTAGGGTSYNWDGGESPGSATNTFTSSGKYTVIATNANGCSYSASVDVTVNPQPSVFLNNMIVKDGVPMKVKPIITGDIVNYQWIPVNGLSNPNIPDPLVNPVVSTQYTLTIINADGCQASAIMKVEATKSKIIVPNTFTPNGDGINDTWNIQYLSQYTDASIDIYNRYGRHLFHSLGYDKPWDGTINGKPIPVGTYYYIIDLHNAPMPEKGYVTILR